MRVVSLRGQVLGLLVARGLGSALQAAALILLARTVSPAAFGVLNAVVGVVGVLLVVTGLGLSLYVPLARAAQEHDNVAAGLRLNAWSNIATAALAVPALWLWTAANGFHPGLVLIGLSLALERNVDTLLGVSVADGKSGLSAGNMLLRRCMTLAVMVPAILAGVDPIWSYTAGLVLGAVAAQLHVRRSVSVTGEAAAVPVRTILHLAWPFLASNVAGQSRTLDTAVVSAAVGPATAGLYAAAAKLVQPLLLIPQTLSAVVMPRAKRMSPGAAQRLGYRLALLAVASILAVVPIAFIATDIVVLVMGEPYAAAGPALAWSMGALPFIVLGAAFGSVLQGQGHQRVVAVNGLVFAAVGLAACGVGAVLAGATGAAIGLALGSAMRAGVLAFRVWKLA
jgi:O-antigen/teichoic acid export membrane protein